MQAIITKYIGPSNTKAGRIKATWRRYDGHKLQVTVEYDHALSERDNHAAAAMKLCRMGMEGGNEFWYCGELDNGYAFVMQGEQFSRHFGKQPGSA